MLMYPIVKNFHKLILLVLVTFLGSLRIPRAHRLKKAPSPLHHHFSIDVSTHLLYLYDGNYCRYDAADFAGSAAIIAGSLPV
jgi:hypothetical protein